MQQKDTKTQRHKERGIVLCAFVPSCLCVAFFFSVFCSSVVNSLEAWEDSLRHLTLEEKIGQMIMIHVHGQDADENARYLIQEKGIGGVIYYEWANGLESLEQVRSLSSGLQSMATKSRSGIPLLISIDQEGGLVCRLKNDFTVFPGNAALSRTKKREWAKQSAQMIGQELRSAGISVNLAPVIDVASSSQAIIGIRSFGANAEEVAEWGKHTLEGYRASGILATLKHFPGHGGAQVDSHLGLPVVLKTREELEKKELVPFRKLAPQADLIMTAHVSFPALDPEFPVTYSKKIIEGILRDDLKFSGVVISDSLAMEGAKKFDLSIEKCALKCIQAGHDIVLLGGKQLLSTQDGFEFSSVDVDRVVQFLTQAVREGTLLEKRIDESVTRILQLKKKVEGFDSLTDVDFSLHRELACAIAKEAIEVVKGKEFVPLKRKTSSTVLLFVPSFLRKVLNQISWCSSGLPIDICEYDPLCIDHESMERMKDKVKVSEDKHCVFITSGGFSYAEQNFFSELLQMDSKAVVVSVRGPELPEVFMKASVVVCMYSPVEYSLEAAFRLLFDESLQ